MLQGAEIILYYNYIRQKGKWGEGCSVLSLQQPVNLYLLFFFRLRGKKKRIPPKYWHSPGYCFWLPSPVPSACWKCPNLLLPTLNLWTPNTVNSYRTSSTRSQLKLLNGPLNQLTVFLKLVPLPAFPNSSDLNHYLLSAKCYLNHLLVPLLTHPTSKQSFILSNIFQIFSLLSIVFTSDLHHLLHG